MSTVVDAPPTVGLRERKKARRRALIAETAMGLFAARGFEEVTVAEIAEAVELSIGTVFNYFPTKEDLFFDRQSDIVEHQSRVVLARMPGESFLDACRRDMLELIAARDWRAGLVDSIAGFYRLVDRSPALQARSRLMVDQSVAHLALTIATELHISADDIVAVATASTLTALRTSLLDQARRGSLAGEHVDSIAARLTEATERAFALVGGDLVTLGSDHEPSGGFA